MRQCVILKKHTYDNIFNGHVQNRAQVLHKTCDRTLWVLPVSCLHFATPNLIET